MSWRIITEADVLTQISGAELTALRGVVLGDGQDDPVQPSIDAITAKVRGFVAGNINNKLDANPAAIPDRLIDAAVSLIICRIISRTTMEPNATRLKDAEAANSLLRDVASGKFSITDPVSGTESKAGGATVIGKRTPRITRDNMGGF
jgi:hypothetical protein